MNYLTHYYSSRFTGLLFCFLIMTGCELCNKDDTTLCKPENHKSIIVNLTAPVNAALPGGSYTNSPGAGNRTFIWTRRMINVCPLANANLKVRITTTTPTPPTVIIEAFLFVSTQGQLAQLKQTPGSSLILEGQSSLYLEPIYGTDPGWYEGVIKVTVPSQGVLKDDEHIVTSIVSSMSLTFEYFEN